MTTIRSTCALLACLVLSLLQQALPAVTGAWQGTVGRQRLTLTIEQAPDASFHGTLVSVDQGNASIPIDAVTVNQDGAVRLHMTSIGASYEGRLSADGSAIDGTWQQGGASIALVFRRPGAAAAAFTLKKTTKGRVALEPCRAAGDNIEALCGTYEVFENRRSKTGRRIALNVMVLPAKTAAPEPDAFFALAGGPGQSATEAFPLAGYVARIRDHRDVVLVDQRGTGKSNPLACALLPRDDAQAILGEAYALERIRQCRADSDAKADTTQYTTSIAADDLDELRAALGYDRIDVFGGSYGAKAALVYQRRHGAHVRSLTLEAVAPPQFLIPLPFAKGVESSIDGVISLCEADAGCRKAYPDLRARFRTLVDRLAKAPAHFEARQQAVVLSKEMFLSKLRTVLYVPQFLSAFPIIVSRAYDGDWAPYAGAVLQLTAALDGVVARGASFAAICAEDVPALTPERIRAATAGTLLGDSQVRRYQEYCRAWGTAGTVPKDFYAPVRSDVPALLISGALDPATPPAMADLAAQGLRRSRLLTVKQGTHGTGSACVDGLIAEFVSRGSAGELDGSCVDRIQLPPFVVR